MPKRTKPTTEEAKKPGRPSKYTPEYCERVANLCAQGLTDFEIAQDLDVHVATLYRWQAEIPVFREALKAGKDLADERVERSLYHRAVGYSYSAVKILQNNGAPVIVPYTEHVPPDVGAGTLWLTNRRRDHWKQKPAVQIGAEDGQPVNLKVTFVDA